MHQLNLEGDLARRLGQAGADRAGHFRWDRTAAEVLSVLKDVA
jgi:hypothetical protein